MPANNDATMTESLVQDVKIKRDGSPATKVLVLTCVADSGDGSFSKAVSQATMDQIGGHYMYEVGCLDGTTNPTADSDLNIQDSRTKVFLSSSGNGGNLVTNTGAYVWTLPDGKTVGSTNQYHLIHSAYPLTVSTVNQAVNSANFTIYIELVPN